MDINECSLSEGVRQGLKLGDRDTLLFSQINYCGSHTNCNNSPGSWWCNEDDCKSGYTNWRANVGTCGYSSGQVKLDILQAVTESWGQPTPVRPSPVSGLNSPLTARRPCTREKLVGKA